MKRIANFVRVYRDVRTPAHLHPEGIPALPRRAAIRWAWIGSRVTPRHLYLVGLAIELIAGARALHYYRVNPNG